MSDKPFAPATDRNKDAILQVLRREFCDVSDVLEIGSGTGQHAVHFAAHLGHLSWQTSDMMEHHAGIRAWTVESELANISEPLDIDVLETESLPRCGAVFSANTAHIMSFAAVTRMFELVSDALPGGGRFVLYGPFRRGGEFNAQSNADFSQSLQARDSSMGIRDLEALDDLAETGNMYRVRLYAMPANNYIAVWRKNEEDPGS